MSIGTVEERSRVLVVRCRQLADNAADPKVAEALREIASDFEALLSILNDARGKSG